MRGINHPRYDTYCMVAPILYGRLYFDLQKIGNAPVLNQSQHHHYEKAFSGIGCERFNIKPSSSFSNIAFSFLVRKVAWKEFLIS